MQSLAFALTGNWANWKCWHLYNCINDCRCRGVQTPILYQ